MFNNLETFVIKNNYKESDEINALLSTPFPFCFSKLKLVEDWKDHKNKEMCFWYLSYKCLTKLHTESTNIEINQFCFNESNQLNSVIKTFYEAKSIDFVDWSFVRTKSLNAKYSKYEHKGIEIKKISFINWNIKESRFIEEVIFYSGLANKLEKISFSGSNEPSIDQLIEKNEKKYGLKNCEII